MQRTAEVVAVLFSVFFYLSRKMQSTIVASLKTAADVFRDRLGGHCTGGRVKPCPKRAQTSPLGGDRAPFETEVSAT